MNKVKVADLQFGLSMEEKARPQLETYFGKLYNNNDHFKYHPIDFKTDKYIESDKQKYAVEYKRRRINFGQYPTLMVNKSKIIKGREYVKKGMRVFYTWECNNDWYFWELNEEEHSWGIGGTNKRGCEDWVDVAHINNQFISKLSDLSLHN